jgi:hypothetical protein
MAGVQLGYVSAQLGHADVAVTATDGPLPPLESRRIRRIPSFGVPYMPKCLEWAFAIPIRQ